VSGAEKPEHFELEVRQTLVQSFVTLALYHLGRRFPGSIPLRMPVF
jgi:hypothetical protein